MKEYEMIVKMYDADMKKLYQVWKGSELFDNGVDYIRNGRIVYGKEIEK